LFRERLPCDKNRSTWATMTKKKKNVVSRVDTQPIFLSSTRRARSDRSAKNTLNSIHGMRVWAAIIIKPQTNKHMDRTAFRERNTGTRLSREKKNIVCAITVAITTEEIIFVIFLPWYSPNGGYFSLARVTV